MTDDMTQAVSGEAVIYTGQGGYEVIEVRERAVRPPGAGEVRITVAAAAVNPTDILLRDPGMPGLSYPVTPGMDAAGVVEAVGPGVSRLRVGDEVMAAIMPRRPEGGAQARHVIAPAASVVAIPEGAGLAEASTLPMNGLTALQALELAALPPGRTLAVSGGAGLLAHYAIAAAKRQGLTVVADARHDEVDLVRGYGADIVVRRSSDFAGAVRETSLGGADALLDTALLGEPAFGAIRDGGVYLPVRGWSGSEGQRKIRIRPVFVVQALNRTDWLQTLREMVTSGEIRLRVAAEYPPEQTVEAQRLLAAGGVRGRPVIVFS